MKLYKFLPYDKNLVSKARELRKTQTNAEKIFWFEILKDKRFANLKFTSQKPVGNFIVDFYCAQFKLAIEIDGDIHKFQSVRDSERDNSLGQEFGLKIIRYKNQDVINDTLKVLEDLISKIRLLNPSRPPLVRVGENS
ncbi:endonuclease domain-containing protein [Candidatus Nomurabacteria bacterium]|nr:endonuclease domain-containing protein [Candidatus Nomurabacteria bacterium]